MYARVYGSLHRKKLATNGMAHLRRRRRMHRSLLLYLCVFFIFFLFLDRWLGTSYLYVRTCSGSIFELHVKTLKWVCLARLSARFNCAKNYSNSTYGCIISETSYSMPILTFRHEKKKSSSYIIEWPNICKWMCKQIHRKQQESGPFK